MKPLKYIAVNVNYIPVIATAFFSLISMNSCQSHEQKADDAFETVKQEKMAGIDSEAIIELPKKNEEVKKNEEPVSEWDKFRIEIEKKILSNELKIKAIKRMPDANSKSFKRVSGLEKNNIDLRTRMDDYNKEEKLRWIEFRSKMNDAVNNINSELNDMSNVVKK